MLSSGGNGDRNGSSLGHIDSRIQAPPSVILTDMNWKCFNAPTLKHTNLEGLVKRMHG